MTETNLLKGLRPLGKVRYQISIVVEYDFDSNKGKILQHRSFPCADNFYERVWGRKKKTQKKKPTQKLSSMAEDDEVY